MGEIPGLVVGVLVAGGVGKRDGTSDLNTLAEKLEYVMDKNLE